MSRRDAARITFGLTALAAVVGLAFSLYGAATSESEQFTSAAARILNQLCFFTLQSNIIVAVTCGLLAVSLDRTSTVFQAFRLAGVVDILVTGVIYYSLLDQPQDRWVGAVANLLLHAVVPVAGVAGWLVFGPKRRISVRLSAYAALVPLVWLVFTLVRGAVIDWYPYPFVDVSTHGYGRVMANVAAITVFFVVLYGLAILLRRRAAPDSAVDRARG